MASARDVWTTVQTWSAAASSGVLGPVAAGLSLWEAERADGVIRFWCRSLLSAASVQSEVRGLSHLPEGPCVLACNHQSHFDAPLVFAHVPKHIRFVAKSELFRIPIFGQALRATGNLEVDRTGGSRDRLTLTRAVDAVRSRVSVMFYAEGSRSEDGQLRPFKKGASVLAIQAQVPLVPMAVAGTSAILPKGARTVRGGQHAVLSIGEPISTVGLTLDQRDALTDRLHAAVTALLQDANRSLVPRGG